MFPRHSFPSDFAVTYEEIMGWGDILEEIGYAPGDYPRKWKFSPPPKKWCDGGLPDPQIEVLAERMELTTEEVVNRLCNGVSVGLLQRAVKLAAELEVPLDEILANRA
jgi:hypothetical protein